MKVMALSVGGPREVEWRGDRVRTSIFKERVTGVRRVALLNIDGDQQSDLSVHGGRYKAVYAYPSEHYPLWRSELAEPDLAWGGFGENLTTVGLEVNDARLGEHWRVGSEVVLQVTTPRIPCSTFRGWMGEKGWAKIFVAAGRPGAYLRIITPGSIRSGDAIEVVRRPDHGVTISLALRVFGT